MQMLVRVLLAANCPTRWSLLLLIGYWFCWCRCCWQLRREQLTGLFTTKQARSRLTRGRDEVNVWRSLTLRSEQAEQAKVKVEKVKRAHSDANHNKASIREEVNIAAFASSDQEKESKQQRNSFENTKNIWDYQDLNWSLQQKWRMCREWDFKDNEISRRSLPRSEQRWTICLKKG